jgi:hypothetical protein
MLASAALCATIDAMLIPRFTLRWLLGLTTLCAGVSLIISMAVRGDAWAIGMVSGLAAAGVVATLFVFAFLVAWLLAQIERAVFGGGPPEGVSPFASSKLPESPFGDEHRPPADASDSPSPLTG